MSDTPKFTVVDRRKFRGDDSVQDSAANAPAAPTDETPVKAAATQASASAASGQSGPRLTLVEPPAGSSPAQQVAPVSSNPPAPHQGPVAVEDEPETGVYENGEEGMAGAELPPAPTAEEASFQKVAYERSAERIDDLVRAQNPGAPAPEKIGFEHLVQQLYLSAMMQMGAGTPEGQRPRIDILGARQTIDLVVVVVAKTVGNLKAEEDNTLQTVLYELRITFVELTRMVGQPQPVPPVPPHVGARR